MAAEVEEDALLLARLAAADGLDDRAADGVRGFGGGDSAFGGGEQLGRLEALDLMEGRRLDQAQLRAQADHRGHAVVAQPAGVDARRHEAVAQREHLDQRRQLGRVAEVVAVLAAAHRGAGVRLAGTKRMSLPCELVADERERQARRSCCRRPRSR